MEEQESGETEYECSVCRGGACHDHAAASREKEKVLLTRAAERREVAVPVCGQMSADISSAGSEHVTTAHLFSRPNSTNLCHGYC